MKPFSLSQLLGDFLWSGWATDPQLCLSTCVPNDTAIKHYTQVTIFSFCLSLDLALCLCILPPLSLSVSLPPLSLPPLSLFLSLPPALQLSLLWTNKYVLHIAGKISCLRSLSSWNRAIKVKKKKWLTVNILLGFYYKNIIFYYNYISVKELLFQLWCFSQH